MKPIERLQYPDPNFIRKKTQIINDGWLFSFDGVSWREIRVPFCPESKLSGIGHTDFIEQCFYQKKIDLHKTDERVIIHFGAVDYRCILYVNGGYVGSHVGGYTPFSFDITDVCSEGENILYLQVFDHEQRVCPSGKQSHKKQSFGCFYSRTTGIWQNVWLEFVPRIRLVQLHFSPSAQKQSVQVDLSANGCADCCIEIFYEDRLVGLFRGEISYHANVEIDLREKFLWESGCGRLYDVVVTFGEDLVFSYFGLRDVCYRGYEFLLNGKPVFQKLVLDQGYYPDGIYTAPGCEAMQRDIRLALDLGFNGARLHQKVFDPRFLYLCDVNGYMVWGEYASWGVDFSSLRFFGRFLQEWEETLSRDFNHPSIVTWCPLNETWGTWEDAREKRDVRFVDLLYDFTKVYDPTRPCVDVSGGHHGHKTDLFDFHCYADASQLREYLNNLDREDALDVPLLYGDGECLRYPKGVPVNLSEFGGVRFTSKQDENIVAAVNDGMVESEGPWGYGKGELNADAFLDRYEMLVQASFSCRKLSGFCYTQLYDVEQEENGLYRYDRTDKFTEDQKARIRRINSCR